jgi:hypothetical protein
MSQTVPILQDSVVMQVAPDDPRAPVVVSQEPAVPDNPTLGDWRVGLTLWGRMDDVTAKVAALVASSDASQAMLGKIATERLEYSNFVQRATLLSLKDALGFTTADVDESLWRAHQVSIGDLSGTWPLTTTAS